MRPTTRAFVWGVVLTFAGTWAWHAFVKPLPRGNMGGSGLGGCEECGQHR